MSRHSSFKGVSSITSKRSVFTRYERIEILKKKGKWDENKSVYGLPKVKTEQ
jgi:small basic protein (TIGR04137 family)